MCRRNHLLGLGVCALGLGLLLGLWFENGFLGHCLGFLALFGGLACLLKK